MTDSAPEPQSAGPATKESETLGINAWYLDDMYQRFVSDPGSVDSEWRAYFGNGGATNGHAPAPAAPPAPPATPPVIAPPPAPAAPAPAPAPASTAAAPKEAPATPPPSTDGDVPAPLRGVAARIVENMVTSISVPTATSVHPLPAKILEVNRRAINEQLAERTGAKVSFTHLIAYAIVRGLVAVPALNASFVADIDGKGTPGVVRHSHVGLGLAIDIARPDGTRSLFVPAIKAADTLDFAAFVAAYEDLVHRARDNKLTVEDFAGVNVTVTNPGTLGTTQSVPRLMAGQGAIIGVGALDFPVEYQGTDPQTLAALGIGKVLTLTSTYDHRIIQGAESGLFLKHVHELLVGEHDFYGEVFRSLGLSGSPATWGTDRGGRRAGGPGGEKSQQVRRLVDAYREYGHLGADLDPLAEAPPALPAELELGRFGLSVWDLDRRFEVGELGSPRRLGELIEFLRERYCGHIGVQFAHVGDPDEREFLRAQLEGELPALSDDERIGILERLTAAEGFERFLQLRYVSQRRFGLEGGETTITFLDGILERAAAQGSVEAVLGMAHRGRLNVLVNVVGKSFGAIFEEFEGSIDPNAYTGSGDVKYHKGAVGKWTARSGASLAVTLASNPSHLEAVDPVVEGITRAKQDRSDADVEHPILAVLIHGDAAVAAQGVVAETFNMSQVPAYLVGGTVHLVINNQVGFTTDPVDGRSTRYATDIAKMIDAPIFHVNGDDPDAVAQVARLAMAYRERFHKDVVVDLVCYRLRGHNEQDDPSYTQPLMYKKIEAHPSVRALYAGTLEREGLISPTDADALVAQFGEQLQSILDDVRAHALPELEAIPERRVSEVPRLAMATGVERPILDALAQRMHAAPDGFEVHPKLVRQFEQRAELYAHGEVDWALGEAFAYGSLLLEGVDIRLIGQDTERGTFSHRHAVLVDYATGRFFAPLDALDTAIGPLEPLGAPGEVGNFYVRDSVLSEFAALGFEYGYSVEAPDALVIWEAQFGDFANGAQIIIDNFIAGGQEKWNQISSLVMLLPHGYEGQGAEHSSARLERFLSLAANDNFTVAQPTNAAQFFHLLRAQAHRSAKRPLIVCSPKSLLRARSSRAAIDAFSTGGFAEVLDDPARDTGGLDAAAVRRVLLCSGKVAFDAIARRDARRDAANDVAVVRVEQLAPWPEAQIAEVLAGYPSATTLTWLQDEPENMGGWTYVYPRLMAAFSDRFAIGVVSRAASGSPATGLHAIHDLEVEMLADRAVGELPHVG